MTRLANPQPNILKSCRRFTLILIVLGILTFTIPFAVKAQGILPECALTQQDPATACGYCDFIKLAVNVSRLGLGILGGVTLAFFGWGGLMLLLSAGNREKINKGWQILLGAMMGLAIVVLAWTMVNFIVWALVSGEINTIGDVKIFPTDAKGIALKMPILQHLNHKIHCK